MRVGGETAPVGNFIMYIHTGYGILCHNMKKFCKILLQYNYYSQLWQILNFLLYELYLLE